MRKFIYAGIGSRITPDEALQWCESIGNQLGKASWHLRSGYAAGADMAFGRGAEAAGGSFEMFLPWEGFNGAPQQDDRFIVPTWTADLLAAAEAVHPVWSRLTSSVKCLMARNVCQVLGLNLDEPADCVICWTPGGQGQGGTGQAVRLARKHNIPVFDLAKGSDREALVRFVDTIEGK